MLKELLLGFALASSLPAADVRLSGTYSPASSSERTVSDVSSVMTIDSKDSLVLDELVLRGNVATPVYEQFAAFLDASLSKKSGTLNRNSKVMSAIDISEKGDLNSLENNVKLLVRGETLGLGAHVLSQNEKRDYVQTSSSASNKITSEQNMTALGPMVRASFAQEYPFLVLLDCDVSYFSGADESFALKFDKSVPGDPSFERKRKVDAIVLNANASVTLPYNIGLITEVGLEGNVSYLSKKVKQTSTTEKYMPVYEEYDSSRLRYSLEGFARMLDFRAKLGVQQELFSSNGSFGMNETQTRFYAGVDYSFGIMNREKPEETPVVSEPVAPSVVEPKKEKPKKKHTVPKKKVFVKHYTGVDGYGNAVEFDEYTDSKGNLIRRDFYE